MIPSLTGQALRCPRWCGRAVRFAHQDLGGRSADWVQRLNRTGHQVAKAVAAARSIAAADLAAERAKIPDGEKRRQLITGRIRGLPAIQQPDEMFNSAMKDVRKLRPQESIQKRNDRSANLAARSLDTLMKGITVKLKEYKAGFPTFESLHPFEQSLMQLSVGEANYERIVNNFDKLRKAVNQAGKAYAAEASKALTAEEAERVQAEGIEMLRTVVLQRGKGIIQEAMELSRKMRKVPQIDLFVPTVALIGAPNVGKSSLVTVLSSGQPEICNYPFTTRTVKMGHFFVNHIRHQVTDTPGLLYRPDLERNAMEKLTVATLEHLPTAALFVLDLTEECGCSVQHQWSVRTELLQRFPHKLWIDVISKADMLEEELDSALQLGPQVVPGVDAVPVDAVQVIRWLPHATIVSAVTEAGLEQLKEAVLDLMQAESWATQVDNMLARDATMLACDQ